MLYSFLAEIKVNKDSEVPIYIQIANEVTRLIKSGILKSGTKLLGTRKVAEILGVHRQTVVAAFNELVLEGWLVSKPQKGIFVNEELPDLQPIRFINDDKKHPYPKNTGFTFTTNPHFVKTSFVTQKLMFDDGFPDIRLSPLKEIAQTYSSVLRSKPDKKLLSYNYFLGNELMRNVLAENLNQFRGLNISPENILLTRGGAMAIYMVASLLLKTGDNIIVGNPNYFTANLCFLQTGANLLTVSVDESGLVIDEVEILCKKHIIRALYITSHHHHPTTATLSPERRVALLQLAEKYRFAIIEDDYDYDYHYQNKPLLPLASADREGLVIYIGSFSKKITPAIRLGFVIAPENFMDELCRLRRIIDRMGDPIMEKTIGLLLKDGTIKRFSKKALKIYKERRDYFCEQLKQNFSEWIDFRVPDGGMAVWTKYSSKLPLTELSQKCFERGLYLSDGSVYQPREAKANQCRMGFASMDLEEMELSLEILKSEIEKLIVRK
jgi:GntR family transcriptional regulator/MocR family aminotransferase